MSSNDVDHGSIYMFDVQFCPLKFGFLSLQTLFNSAYLSRPNIVSEKIATDSVSNNHQDSPLQLNIMLSKITAAALVILPIVFSVLKPCPKSPVD
jgi:hypothetical protein